MDLLGERPVARRLGQRQRRPGLAGRLVAVLAMSSALVVQATPAMAAPATTARPTSAQLRALGVSVSWPVAARSATVAPQTKLRVEVWPRAAREGESVRVSVVRLTSAGKVSHVVRRRSLKRGLVTTALAKTPGRRYAVTVRAGELRSRTVLTIEAPPEAPVPAPPGSTPPAPPPGVGSLQCDVVLNGQNICDAERAAGFLHISRAPAVPGEQRSYLVESTGSTCLTGGEGHGWSRLLSDGTWEHVPNSPLLVWPAIAYCLPPGATKAGTASVPDNAVPGRYRLTVAWGLPVPLSVELDVVAPPAG